MKEKSQSHTTTTTTTSAGGGVRYLNGVSTTAAVEPLSDPFVQVPHIVQRVEEGGHVQNLTEQEQGL